MLSQLHLWPPTRRHEDLPGELNQAADTDKTDFLQDVQHSCDIAQDQEGFAVVPTLN